MAGNGIQGSVPATTDTCDKTPTVGRNGPSRRLAVPVDLRGDLVVHRVRSHVDVAGPCYGALIDEGAVEELSFPQRRQRPGQFFWTEANAPAQSVLKTDEQAAVRLGFDFDDVPIHFASTQDSGSMRAGGCVLTAEPPILQQFLSMHHRPFPHQVQSAGRERSFQDNERGDLDRGLELAIAGMKCAGGCSLKNMRISIP